MKNNNITSHARKRMQQRGINATVIRLIETFGEFQYQKGGSYYAYVTEETISTLRQSLETLKTARAMYGETDRLITVMHETAKIRRTNYSA